MLGTIVNVAAIISGSLMGSVFIYQGVITLTASSLKPLLTPAVINEMSAVGGLLIMAIGMNLLEIKKIKVGNMLPAIFFHQADDGAVLAVRKKLARTNGLRYKFNRHAVRQQL